MSLWCILFGKMWKNMGKIGNFSRWIWPDWQNTAWAGMAGLGSIIIMVKMFLIINHKADLLIYIMVTWCHCKS